MRGPGSVVQAIRTLTPVTPALGPESVTDLIQLPPRLHGALGGIWMQSTARGVGNTVHTQVGASSLGLEAGGLTSLAQAWASWTLAQRRLKPQCNFNFLIAMFPGEAGTVLLIIHVRELNVVPECKVASASGCHEVTHGSAYCATVGCAAWPWQQWQGILEGTHGSPMPCTP